LGRFPSTKEVKSVIPLKKPEKRAIQEIREKAGFRSFLACFFNKLLKLFVFNTQSIVPASFSAQKPSVS